MLKIDAILAALRSGGAGWELGEIVPIYELLHVERSAGYCHLTTVNYILSTDP